MVHRKTIKGFTLIELLGIIIVIGLVFVIITPIITNSIEETSLVLAKSNADSYRKKINQFLIQRKINKQFSNIDGQYLINKDGSLSNEENVYPISLTGKAPKAGYIRIVDDTVDSGCVQINQYAVTIENKLITTAKEGQCEMPEIEIAYEEFPQVKDKNPGIICGTGTEEDYDNSSVCYIYSVEDLVQFSNLTNSGKTFEDKTVMLMNNLDIENEKSYADINSNDFEDVNENGTVEETLIEELVNKTSSSKGLKPASTAYKFKGTFEGQGKKINNLYINRTSLNYVALIGYNEGTIRGVQLNGMTSNGSSYVGLITGYNKGNVTSTIANGNASGYRYIGLGAGKNEGTLEIIGGGNVSASYDSYSYYAYVGGITGYTTTGTVKGIYVSGNVSAYYASYPQRTIGYKDSGVTQTIAANTTKINGSTSVSDTGLTTTHGYTAPESGIYNIAMLDTVLDTFVNSDNNNDGYYYDNNTEENITIYSTIKKPLNITMAGDGTADSPYIINNYDDLRQATYNRTKYYKLNADIDLSDKKELIFGGYSNTFTGSFDGNGHTISNLTLVGMNSVGFFGNNAGTVKGITLDNASISGSSYIGILSGYNSGSITTTIANGNASGYRYIGLGAGKNEGTLEIIGAGDVSASYDSYGYYAFVGGIAGYTATGTVKGIYVSGNVSAYVNSYPQRTIGYKDSGVTQTIAANTTKINGSTSVSDTGLTTTHGYTAPATGIYNIAMLDTVLDTYIAGDNNGDKCYYDNDEDGNAIVRSTERNPFIITMQGLGTDESPYIITNYDQLKEAAYDLTKHYKLNANIDLTGQNQIMLGGYVNTFTGTFEGNGYTINKLKLVGMDYVGLFGKNTGTVKGVKLTNANVSGSSYIGILAGYNNGNITTTIVNGNASGYRYVAVGVGQNNSTLETITSGNATASYASYSNYALVGGITGHAKSGTVKGIYVSGNVSADGNSYPKRTIGYIESGTTNKTIASNATTVNGSTSVSDTGLTSMQGYTSPATGINNIAMLDTVLDTFINSDNNEDGYCYDYDEEGNTIIRSIEKNPFRKTMSGEGTTNSPYIITNYTQLKEAAYDLSKNYKLNTDIDLTNQNPVMLGGYANTFTGVFDGNGYTISNLTLVGMNSVGFFGNNAGTVQGVKLTNANISGSSYIGVLAGYNSGNITTTIANGNASGYRYIGAGVGQNDGTLETITIGNATASYDSYGNYAFVGGITGHAKSGTVKGIYVSGNVSAYYASYPKRTIGYIESGTTNKTIASNATTVNENTSVSDTGLTSMQGYTSPATGIYNIAMLDTVLDTYIAGDNNEDKYYYDNDESGNAIIRSMERKPFTITMQGQGTDESPYIITSYAQLKEAAYDLSKHYKLNTDIDLTNQNPVMLGGYANTFTGTFEGNGYTINKLKLVGMNSVGLFGNNAGIVKGVKLTNANISGSSYIGVLAGYNSGNITTTIANGNASGYRYIGVGVGQNDGTLETITIGNATASYDSYDNYALVGGITGHAKSGTVKGIYVSGNVSAYVNSYPKRTIGYIESGTTNKTIASNATTVNENTSVSDTGLTSMQGYTSPAAGIYNIAMLDTVLDTYINKDNNNDGYYYDNDSNGNAIVRSIERNPFTITMSGSGSEQSPYTITSYAQLKEAAYDLSKNYSLNTDIDLTNQNPIILGGYSNTFTGTFDGNGHTISNLTLKGMNSVGFFGNNAGTIKGLKIDNANISGSSYIGVLAGYNNGNITSTIAYGNASGYRYIGVGVGQNDGTLETITKGNAAASYDSYGNYALVGGITGHAKSGTIKGMYLLGNVSAYINSYPQRTVGYKDGGSITTGASSSATVNDSTSINNTGINNYGGKTYTTANLLTTAPYEEVGLNTSSTSGEYRYAFDTNNNLYIVKN